MTEREALNLLGLAMRAGAVVPGMGRVVEAVRSGSASYVVVAEDLTATGRAKVVPLLEREGVRWTERFTRAQLGGAVGKSPLATVALADAGFGDRLAGLLGDEKDDRRV